MSDITRRERYQKNLIYKEDEYRGFCKLECGSTALQIAHSDSSQQAEICCGDRRFSDESC